MVAGRALPLVYICSLLLLKAIQNAMLYHPFAVFRVLHYARYSYYIYAMVTLADGWLPGRGDGTGLGQRRVRLAFMGAITLCLIAQFAAADEVDDILALKAKNTNRLRRFSAEFTVKTHQPKSLKHPKTVTMRYRMKMERIPKAELKTPHQPWRIETEVLEPLALKMKVEGEQAWFQDQHGKWMELPMTPEIRQQFLGMAERYKGADPKVQKEKFGIKVLRHNNPIFGPRTRTVEFIPKGKAKLYARLEEDINDDGLPLETRIYGEAGKQTMHVKVRKHHKVKGMSVVDEMESDGEGPAGMIISETNCTNIEVDAGP